jgi:hypothetical protein
MNAQTNHPINNTTDPQFLGPEAGQQAGGQKRHKTIASANWMPTARSCIATSQLRAVP